METGYGDASACLKLRIPVTRRDRRGIHQIACPLRPPEMPRKSRSAWRGVLPWRRAA